MKDKNDTKWENVNYNLLEYFWANTFFSVKDEKNLPYFLNKIDIFKDFTELEIFDLVQYMHIRHFSVGEEVVSENDSSMGFYLIISGEIEINSPGFDDEQKISLYPEMFFGEQNLLLDKRKSNLKIISKSNSILAAILTPDLDNLIDKKPRVAVKFIKTLSRLSLIKFEEIEKRIRKKS